MKHVLMVAALLTATYVTAQTAPTPGTSPMQENPAVAPEQDARALSGALKDMLGQVHTELGTIEKKLVGGVSETSRAKLATHREELFATKSQLESALNEVNAGDQGNWNAAREKAQNVLAESKATLERAKEASAVN